VLRQDADSDSRRADHATVVRRFLPSEDAQQRALARAVRADEAKTHAVGEAQVDATQERDALA